MLPLITSFHQTLLVSIMHMVSKLESKNVLGVLQKCMFLGFAPIYWTLRHLCRVRVDIFNKYAGWSSAGIQGYSLGKATLI